jgi:hypothetical protein
MLKLKTPAATPTQIPERIGPWPTLIANQELEAWRLFGATCSAQMSKWERSIEELEETCRLLDEAHGTSARFDEFAQETTAREADLSAKVNAAGQHLYTARYLDRNLKMAQKPSPTIPKRYVLTVVLC